MTALHVYFTLRNQQAFQRLLDSGNGVPRTSSGSKSWTRSNPLSACDVNARDTQGRTVLHLAASATDASAPEYIRKLLAHPHINVNIQDRESHWTALHRALYHGNLSTALLLLQRQDIDPTLKDFEGYTAFDLYNSTVEGTKPKNSEDVKLRAELLTWGTNRNAALGHGDAGDRTFPDPIHLEHIGPPLPESARIDERFAPVQVRQVVMSKLHTGVVTAEPKGNLRVCGFGSGGRLGPGQHTQYNLVPMQQLPQTIISVALGQDHTLALTSSGEVLSWGLNRFAQLGYVLETTQSGGKMEEAIQATPRKIGGALSKKVVVGVAACKTASACWTSTEVYTWGTNHGQLGYDKNAHPVQPVPRVVPRVSQPVISVAIADNAMACLLDTHDVLCLYNDSHFRVTFPAHGFPSEIKIYRPPQAVRSTSIDKITTCDNVFAALSSNGELFTFSFGNPSGGVDSSAAVVNQTRNRDVVKPQRVWSLRKKFSAVKDVALGAEGSIIVCTESGHVFVRTRSGGKTAKFQRVPYIQRVIRVCANSTGAFGALRADADLDPVEVTGNFLKDDLALIQPYLVSSDCTSVGGDYHDSEDGAGGDATQDLDEPIDVDEQDESPLIAKDRRDLARFCRLLLQHKSSRSAGPFSSEHVGAHDANGNRHGADLLINVRSGSQPIIPAHRFVLAARSSILADVLAGTRVIDYKHDNVSIKMSLIQRSAPRAPTSESSFAPWTHPTEVSFKGCHPLTILILLVYLYTDEVLAIWDWRVANSLKAYLGRLGVEVGKIKMELRACAVAFQLDVLASTLEAAFKREVPASLVKDVIPLAGLTVGHDLHRRRPDPLATDVILVLADKEVPCHSVILRAQSPLFKAMFDVDVWTLGRWDEEGVIRVDLGHMKWATVKYVVRFLYGGDREMFDVVETAKSVEELIECMVDVMAAANELLLERLTLLCSAIILNQVTTTNATSILVDATHFNSPTLVRSVQKFIAQSMETFLEGHMLDDLPVDIIKQLSKFVREQQEDKSPLSRSNVLVDLAMQRNAGWLALQDIPQPIVPTYSYVGLGGVGREARISPPGVMKKEVSFGSPKVRPRVSSSRLNPGASGLGDDELFVMDGVESREQGQGHRQEPPLPLSESKEGKEKVAVGPSTPNKSTGWKVASTPRVDMKSIMAEAETNKSTVNTSKLPASRAETGSAASANWRSSPAQAPPPSLASASSSRRPPAGSSPWKSIPTPTPSGLGIPPGNASPALTPPMTPLMKATRIEGEKVQQSTQRSGGRQVAQSQPQSQSQSQVQGIGPAQRPGLGPVFSPSKQTSSKNASGFGVRKPSGPSVAWTLPPVQPVVQSSSAGTLTATTSSSGMSFAAIQQLQLEQGSASASAADKRSLLEIQEEEKARRMEEEFLAWWNAEEERMRVEQEQQAVAQVREQKRPKPRQHQKKQKAGKKIEGGSSRKDGGGSMKEESQVKASGGGTRVSQDKGRSDRRDESGPSTPRRKKKPQATTQPTEKSGLVESRVVR